MGKATNILQLFNESKTKKELISDAKRLAQDTVDESTYKIKDYFGGWAEDVVGRELSVVFDNAYYTEASKLFKKKVRK